MVFYVQLPETDCMTIQETNLPGQATTKKETKNQEKPKRKTENNGCLLNVNTVTVCQEQFGMKKEQRAAWEINFMYAQRRKTG